MSAAGDGRRVELERISATVERLSISIAPGQPAPATPDVLRVWGEMHAANPRLFNGPILAVESLDARGGEIRARRDTYQRLVVQPRVHTGVRQLSVTAIVIARDKSGRPSVLLGRRSDQTRMYAGLWELGPSGGVEPPPAGIDSLPHDWLTQELRREAVEEADLEIHGFGAPLAIVYDPRAESYDIVLKVSAAPTDPAASPRGWEYSEIRWVPVHDLRTVVRTMGDQLIPPTREIIHAIDMTRFTDTEGSEPLV